MTEPDWEAEGRAWWSHVRVLADDSMEGRATGSRGYQRAADYVADQFRRAGLKPAGTDGYLQSIDFLVNELVESQSSLSLLRGTSEQKLTLRDAAQIWVTSATLPDVEAEAVFVGYGLDIPELDYHDLADVDLRGKIAVYFRGGPSDIPDSIKAHFQSTAERNRALRRAGAVGSVRLVNPKIPDLPWDRFAAWVPLPKLELSERGPEETRPLPLSVVFNPDRFDLLLPESGHTGSEIMDRLGAPGPLPRFPLNVRLRAHVEVKRGTTRSTNVVGVWPGSESPLQNEYVVGTAHLDHLGIGEPVHGDPVYHGAMDNASGVATLIEIARRMRDLPQQPKRSILFLAVTGEENGLLGSEYFARHPTVEGRLIADLNMDMFFPLFPMRYLEAPGFEESSLGSDLRTLAGEAGIEVHGDHEPERVLFIRSDQYNFVKIGVPALMMSIGYSKGSPEEATASTWLHERYHSPADDLEQPVDLVAAAKFTDLLGRFMLGVSNEPKRPTWKADSFFRRFAR